jgi:5'-3' exonuclease, N-terminal resolvase-like domain|nr:MAG TPA: 5'-3' exonuclease [Caudoviricetes sp.]
MNTLTKESLFQMIVRSDEILLIDVSNFLYRYAWAYRDKSVSINGVETKTGHIYGFLKFLTRLENTFNNPSIVLCLDGLDTSRKELNPYYKANRSNHSDMKEVILSTTDDIVKMSSMITSVYSCYDSNFEADDCIHSIVSSVSSLCDKNKVNKSVYILSNDKDMFQLVKDTGYATVNIIRKLDGTSNWKRVSDIVDEGVVRDTFNGVSPKDLVKYRSIVGDSSDNLRGYYRFLKSKASEIANNFDYDIKDNKLVQKNGSLINEDITDKYLPIIMNDFHIFESNYAIMKMKLFDFEISPISVNHSKEDISDIVSLINLYRMDWFLGYCMRRSLYGSYVRELCNV